MRLQVNILPPDIYISHPRLIVGDVNERFGAMVDKISKMNRERGLGPLPACALSLVGTLY